MMATPPRAVFSALLCRLQFFVGEPSKRTSFPTLYRVTVLKIETQVPEQPIHLTRDSIHNSFRNEILHKRESVPFQMLEMCRLERIHSPSLRFLSVERSFAGSGNADRVRSSARHPPPVLWVQPHSPHPGGRLF